MNCHIHNLSKKIILIFLMFLVYISSNSQSKEKSIVILVNFDIYNAINNELNTFKADLELDKYNVILKNSTYQTPEEIREYLQTIYNSTTPKLIGAILMGQIPLAKQFFIVTYGNPDLSPTTHNCFTTQFYSDLDGNFIKNDPAYPESYSEHTGDTIPEIWVSVLPYYKSIPNTISQIKQYLNKNHEYRNGNIDIQDGFIEVNEHYRADNEDDYNYYINLMKSGPYSWTPFTEWGNVGLYIYNSIGKLDIAYAYEEELRSNKYTFAALTAHGSYYTNGELSIPEIKNMEIKPVFVWLGGCNTGNLDYNENIATEILYSSLNNVLVTKGGTSNVGGLGNNENGFFGKNIATAMLEGKSIGEALLYHNQIPLIYPWSTYFEMHNAPNIFFGDLSLTIKSIATMNEYKKENSFLLEGNIPNPFSQNTLINYRVHKNETVFFTVYNLMGRRVFYKEINNQESKNSLLINTSGWENGVYFLTMETGNSVKKSIKLIKIE
ncbi:C25 family cysteine peptidase [Prolixibacteraceae bacterium Z1-6]|uniref:C25 family cysteine peptidase n=1 Tax=Draconibacterium aestuarii TaxID=2998507 RepID=A0A9X3F5Z5_9BACT|nr:C25 family cysteine peptidase [Prolixibacteraceae bacterium Z1-6]